MRLKLRRVGVCFVIFVATFLCLNYPWLFQESSTREEISRSLFRQFLFSELEPTSTAQTTPPQRPANALCPNLSRPYALDDADKFQPVDGHDNTYVFSAFLDGSQRVVRVISIGKVYGHLVCHLWYQEQHKDLYIIAASVEVLPESHNRRYSAAYITCPLPDGRNPYAISLTLQDCSRWNSTDSPTNVLPVHQARAANHTFTVCVTALNFKYSRAYELVEMIEVNRMLGASQFTFYINSVGANVEAVLNQYAKEGVVELMNWTLPVEVDHWPPKPEIVPDVHYFAQLASHNDCLNRHRGSTSYLVYQDLDEFIIPKNHLTWNQLLKDIKNRIAHKPVSAFIVRCVFFRKEWPMNAENFPGRSIAEKFRSIVLLHDKREPTMFNYGHRSKYILDPEMIHVVGIHNIWNFRQNDRTTFEVPFTDALLHHYRSWERPDDSAKAVRDTDMYRFKDELLARLQNRWNQLAGVPLDIPLSSYGQV